MSENVLIKLKVDDDFVAIKTFDRKLRARGRFLISKVRPLILHSYFMVTG